MNYPIDRVNYLSENSLIKLRGILKESLKIVQIRLKRNMNKKYIQEMTGWKNGFMKLMLTISFTKKQKID